MDIPSGVMPRESWRGSWGLWRGDRLRGRGLVCLVSLRRGWKWYNSNDDDDDDDCHTGEVVDG